MEIQLKRRFIGSEYTIGAMSINGVYLCDTLEPVTRDVNKKRKIRQRRKENRTKDGDPLRPL